MIDAVVQEDSGSKPFHLFDFERATMRVPERIRGCVVFLQKGTGKGKEYAGTGFFVGIPVPERPGELVPHVITARHILKGLNQRTDPNIYLRMNFIDDEPRSIPIHASDWYVHPTDDTVDVAVALAPSESLVITRQADILSYEIDRFATEETIERRGIGIGDEVFITGLFGYHPGVKRNIPIVRVGHIAIMPEEPIKTDFTDEMGCKEGMEAYLIEARSFKGLSGCPAFVHLGPLASRKGESAAFDRGGDFYFLGLVVGHFEHTIPNADMMPIDEWDPKKYTVNVGLAVVAPASKIREIIFDNVELVKMRNKQIERTAKQYIAVSDSLTEDEKKDNPFTKTDFEDALKKVSRPKSDEETT